MSLGSVWKWIGTLTLGMPTLAQAAPPALPEGRVGAPTDTATPDPSASPEGLSASPSASPEGLSTEPTTAQPTGSNSTDGADAGLPAGEPGPVDGAEPSADTSVTDTALAAEERPNPPGPSETAPVATDEPATTAETPGDPGMVQGRREGLMPSNSGPIGLFHTVLPDAGGKYTFRFRLHSDFFTKQAFMYDSSTYGSDRNARIRGAVTLSFSPFTWGELFWSVKSSANRNERDQPDRQDAPSTFALGDMNFGLKGAYRFKNGLAAGGVVGLGLLSGSERLRTNSVNFWFDGLFAVDVRYLTTRQIPIRFTANVGWLLDNSLRTANYAAITDLTSREVSRFALGGNHSRVRMRYALDFPVRLGKDRTYGIDPILEWAWDIATTREPAFIQPGATASPLPRGTQWLTLGLRANAIAGLHLDAAADVGLVSPSFEYGPRVPPWQVILGLGWSFDPTPVVKEVKVPAPVDDQPKPGLEGRLVGQVLDPQGNPIPGAKLLFPGLAANALLTDASGGFTSFRFPAGAVTVQVELQDQVIAEAQAEVHDGEDTDLMIQVETMPAPPEGLVQGAVTDDKGHGIPFSLHVTGQGVDEPFASTDDGRIALQLLAGTYRGVISAPGFRDKSIDFTVVAQGEIRIDERLEPAAPPSTPDVTGSRHSIRLHKHIRYRGNAVHPDSLALLDQLATFLGAHPEYELVEVGVHTDDEGAAQQRSDERAEAVVAYLVAQGVAAGRLRAKGYGASAPVAVNLTAQGRAKNNRTVLSVRRYGGT